MLKIEGISNNANQSRMILLPDESQFEMKIQFFPQQYGWFINSITYNTFSVNGIRIVNSFNLLHQYRNIIPFGLACQTEDEREPYFQEDFSSGSSELFLLVQEDLNAIRGLL